MKKNIISSWLLLIVVFFSYPIYANTQKLDYSYDANNGLQVYLQDFAKIKVGSEIECGALRDGAMYASFGLEAQIYRCSKFVIGLTGTALNEARDGEWIFKVEFTPLYDSIKTEQKPRLYYKHDSQGREMDGNNHYGTVEI